ncbi:GNAT family N-acetyltransferase [Shewanella algae]|uniref:GNAT family N-acetyltransferase n=1 Tax=Shewanella algae TaxID=38313 RepID=UPI000C330C86|nr:GNAT family N-acetyltransferase [Shewanella algae]MBO2640891.1 GNAT family N-acetyltransferase [Shewanella algae]MCE9782040.1 GNAT family N-acetyltransferase [Shewanella algae]QTE80784.1 GNAT family N-acetyltransferase [Shewanella algae]WKC43380.1 GNAT family N-acetyltransferase [Shewanella algae]
MSSSLFAPTLETSRLRLRPLQVQDADALLAIFSDPEVMKYWNTAPWTHSSDALDFISAAKQGMTRQEGITLGIFQRDTCELLGKCMLFSYDSGSKRAEIGFGLGKAAWGKGYIQEAGEALIDYGFNTLKLRRIEAEIDPGNNASAKALDKLGFIREGLLRQRWQINGVISDSALYGRLVSD